MKTELNKDVEFKLWGQLLRTLVSMQKVRQKELRKFGISVLEASIIYVVGSSNKNLVPADISRQLIQEAHAISQCLKKMEKKGLLTRNKDLPRKNMIRVELTKEGEKVYQETRKIKSVAPILSILSREQKINLIKTLEKLQQKAIERNFSPI